MDLSRLAAKQKRLKDWIAFAESGGIKTGELLDTTRQILDRYRLTLARCWEAGQVSADDLHQINDLERELESLNEIARMTVAPKH